MSKLKPNRSFASDYGVAPPAAPAVRLVSMCNHGLISEEQAEEVIVRVQQGDQSIDGAIEELQQTCSCGLFLPSRARRILSVASIRPAQ